MESLQLLSQLLDPCPNGIGRCHVAESDLDRDLHVLFVLSVADHECPGIGHVEP
jgi:hypothetical protein